jgi:hypothetical protein
MAASRGDGSFLFPRCLVCRGEAIRGVKLQKAESCLTGEGFRGLLGPSRLLSRLLENDSGIYPVVNRNPSESPILRSFWLYVGIPRAPEKRLRGFTMMPLNPQREQNDELLAHSGETRVCGAW